MVCGLAACGGGGSSASGGTSGGSTGGSTSGGTTSGGTTTGTSGGGTLGGLAGGGTTGGGSTTGGTTTGSTTSGGTTSGGSATGDAGSDARLALINPVNGFQNPVPAITYTRVFDGTTQVRIASGTTAQSATILANGRSRRYVVISPVAGQANAPMLLLLTFAPLRSGAYEAAVAIDGVPVTGGRVATPPGGLPAAGEGSGVADAPLANLTAAWQDGTAPLPFAPSNASIFVAALPRGMADASMASRLGILLGTWPLFITAVGSMPCGATRAPCSHATTSARRRSPASIRSVRSSITIRILPSNPCPLSRLFLLG